MQCPECQAVMEDEALLCIACGFHLGLGEKLSRGKILSGSTAETPADEALGPEALGKIQTDQNQVDELGDAALANPYAVGQAASEQEEIAWSLTERDLPLVKAVANGGIPIGFSVGLAVCVILPFLTVMLPWNLFRLLQWWQLHQRFQNLRQPNSLSPYIETELRFQQAFWQYLVSILLGAVWLSVVVAGLVLRSSTD